MWIKQAYRDYYKPKLRRELKRDPEQGELDQRFEEIYSQVNCILLAGVLEGVAIYFYEIAKFTKEEYARRPKLMQLSTKLTCVPVCICRHADRI
jgi:hypothetical protein